MPTYQELSFFTHPTLDSLTLNAGLTPDQIIQLTNYTNNDPLIIKNSQDKKRFKNIKAFETWLNKGRTIYSLTNTKGDLLGIIWFGKSDFPKVQLLSKFKKLNTQDHQITYAIRLYQRARGQGLAKKFTRLALEAYLDSAAYAAAGSGKIWLETFANNKAAVKTYQPFFIKVSQPDEKNRIVMIAKPEIY